jgi:3-keto-5-aminohexanoate cleavage enzyme
MSGMFPEPEVTPLVITVAPTGAHKTSTDHAALPITPEAIARDASACRAAGAAMLHLHVRDSQGRHSLDVALYREALAAVRDAVGDALLLQVTSEAGGLYRAEQQMDVLRELEPEAASIALRELFEVPEPQLADFFRWLAEQQVLTQLLLVEPDDVQRLRAWRAAGVIPPGPWSVLFVLGRYSPGQRSTPTDLLPFLQAFDAGLPWAACAFGPAEHACTTAAIALGGHVRVGFENNLRLRDGSLAAGNSQLVEQAAGSARNLGRPLADAAAARRLLATPR